jgi:hypothetical protein
MTEIVAKNEDEIVGIVEQQRKIIEELKKKIEEQELIISIYKNEFNEYKKTIGSSNVLFLDADFFNVEQIRVELNLPPKNYNYLWLFDMIGWLKLVWVSSTARYNATFNAFVEKWGVKKEEEGLSPAALIEIEMSLKKFLEKYKYGRFTILNEDFWKDFEGMISDMEKYIEMNSSGREYLFNMHTIMAIQISALVRLLNRYIYKVEGIQIISGEKIVDIPTAEEERKEYKERELKEEEQTEESAEISEESEEPEEPIEEEK